MELVDDEYWISYAKKSVENSISSKNDAAAKLEKMIIWFWGLYTASFTIGVSVNLIDAPYFILLLLASPIVLLIITYWFCILSQLPITIGFDPSIPSEIKNAYNQGFKKKNRRFNFALIFTFISALVLSSALFSLAFVHKKSEPTIFASFNDDKNELIVSGLLPNNTLVTTTIDTLCLNSKIQINKNIYKIQENGLLNLNFPVKGIPHTTIISVTWGKGNIEQGYVQILKNTIQRK